MMMTMMFRGASKQRIQQLLSQRQNSELQTKLRTISTTSKAHSIIFPRKFHSNCVVLQLQQKRRTFSSITTKEIPKSNNNNNNKKELSDYFLDNLGKVFFASIAGVVLMLVRSSRGGTNRANIKTEIENEISVLDPLEIDDLRSLNGEKKMSVEKFRQIMKLFYDKHYFPQYAHNDDESMMMTYQDFVYLITKLIKEKNEKEERGDTNDRLNNIEASHLLDRVAMSVSKSDKEMKLPVPLLFTILSLTLPNDTSNDRKTIDERIQVLFDLMQLSSSQDNNNKEKQKDNSSSNNSFITEQSVIELIHYLQQTNQLAPEPQILQTTEAKYPTQQYHVGSPLELFAFAKNEIALVQDNDDDDAKYTVEDVKDLLRTTFICAWGECYGKRKIVPKAK